MAAKTCRSSGPASLELHRLAEGDASAKFLQTEPTKSKKNQEKTTWIFLDFFVRFGAFQRVMSNPRKKEAMPLFRQALPRRDARTVSQHRRSAVSAGPSPSATRPAPKPMVCRRRQGGTASSTEAGNSTFSSRTLEGYVWNKLATLAREIFPVAPGPPPANVGY